MRAAVLRRPRFVELVDVPVPRPGPGHVLVRVEASSICGSDVNGYRGVNPRMRLPTVLGHETAGTVIAVGPDVPLDVVGRRVAVEPNVSCRACEWCSAGLPNICPSYRVLGESMDVPGALAEAVVVNNDQVYQLPPEVSAAEGALVQPISISYHAVVDRAGVRPGETVVILGAGPIGLAALLIARDLGASCIVTDVIDDRLAVATRLGAMATIRADQHRVGPAVRDLTGGRGADATIEAVGGAQDQSVIDSVEATATRGTIVIVGTFAKAPQPFPAYEFKNRELTVMGSHGHPRTFAPTLDLIARGRIRPSDLITHRLPLAEIDRAFQLVDSHADGVIKVILEPEAAVPGGNRAARP